jgi:hypothetical protein
MTHDTITELPRPEQELGGDEAAGPQGGMLACRKSGGQQEPFLTCRKAGGTQEPFLVADPLGRKAG